ncbi:MULTISPECIES: hypothetical protein [unclassified Streptomyces]|uniref:hypothetical protein n=1 Tax=unclassified Streptomyces TaxID=2593676 RepID=UPI00278BF7F0|nr:MULTISPECIES: hypothetical protein [unclassified Streptomyces]
MSSTEQDVDAGIQQMEGYLLWNSKVTEAHEQAEAFTDRLDWLTGAQREEVQRVFVEERLAFHKAALGQIVARAAELREEYGKRYERLKARCVGICGGVLVGLLSLASLVALK